MKTVTATRKMPTAVLNEVVMDPALVAPKLASVSVGLLFGIWVIGASKLASV